jgi:hypothetical protein
MNMHKLTTFALCFLLPYLAEAQFKYAQKFLEVGAAIGTSSYSGELTKTILDFKHVHLAGGAFARYHFSRFGAVRLQGMYGTISGNDADSKDQINQVRNLSFRSRILDVALTGDFYVLGYNPEKQNMFSPYLSVGLAVFNYKPQAKTFDPNFADQWVNLQPLKTEGQGSIQGRTPYQLTQVSVPLAIGLQYAIHSHINIGLEVGYRVTFTDYLDDVGLYYAVDAVSGQDVYSDTPYRDGYFDNKSEQELFSDRTYEYFVRQQGAQMGDNVLGTPAADSSFQRLKAQRGGNFRGIKGNDSYLFATFTLSYNFIDNGLVGARNRRKSKGGCPGAQF